MTISTLNRETLQTLSTPSILKTLFDFFLVWGVIAATITGALLVNRSYVYVLAIIVIGGRQNALATLAHEGWHGLLFSSRRLNHLAGAWLYSYPIGILYYHDRERHLRHHREVGHDYDPDWINYTNRHRESAGKVMAYLASLLFGRLLFSSLNSFIIRGRPRIGVESTGNARGELLSALFCQALLFSVMTLASDRWWSYPLLWLLPLATFAGFFANFRAFIEHVAVRDDVAPELRLRDIKASPLERILIAPSHFNYHALHHAHPSIPHYNLRLGKEEYLGRLGYYPFVLQEGYLSALFEHMKELRKRT